MSASDSEAPSLPTSSAPCGPSPKPQLTLIRSTDAHPPHHAHFDIPEHPPTPNGGNPPIVDIEHMPCDDDPREWSDMKKRIVLLMMTTAVLGPLIAPSIYNPVIDELKAELHASDTEVGLSISLYILFQGWVPVIWASTAEIIGRKIVYLASYGIYTIGAVVASRAQSMPVLIAMRCVQAIGSSAVVAVGAGSLADMFEVHERGKKLGIFYGLPLLGPAIGPLIGGALGNAFGWRSALYFLAAFAGLVDVMFLFFPDTWRRERSRVYQKAMEGAIKRAMHQNDKRQRKISKGLSSNAPTPPATGHATPADMRRSSLAADVAVERKVEVDTEKNQVVVKRKWWRLGRKDTEEEEVGGHAGFKPTLRDVNPFPTMWSIWRKPANFVILLASGTLFAAFYTLTYTASLTLAAAPYQYNALNIGLVILAFGVGSMVGSLTGGRYSDRVLRRLKKANGGVSQPEMRLQSTIPGLILTPLCFLAYAWTAGKKVHIAGIVVTLFFCGMSLMLIYSSTLAYLVDANPGRSASAVSCNSFIRGTFACVCSQVAQPIQNAIGDGGLYSIFAGVLALAGGGIVLLIFKGEKWRLRDEARDLRESRRNSIGTPSGDTTAVHSSDQRTSEEKIRS